MPSIGVYILLKLVMLEFLFEDAPKHAHNLHHLCVQNQSAFEDDRHIGRHIHAQMHENMRHQKSCDPDMAKADHAWGKN